ncbi:QsdR family transcriptional regulator [Amycolatopsis jejuensis]|uniref:QsdR family transcriptional regulator n=1 Tax=Amycolatopsis jejuensis TaxID=330084 RepID=UPI0005274665|nr:QsdR family transcriptional regulator [Amycolatopsis jejuensis]
MNTPKSTDDRPGATTAFRLARRRFVAGERIDMQVLAADLGVDRSTLFRWVGNRDKLVVDILISLTDPTLKLAVDKAAGSGGARIADVAGEYARTLVEADFFHTFVRREAERSLRLLTSRASPMQGYVVSWFERLLEEEQLTHPMALHDLAYLIVRIIESFVYADMIIGEEPDPDKVRAAIAALLHT